MAPLNMLEHKLLKQSDCLKMDTTDPEWDCKDDLKYQKILG